MSFIRKWQKKKTKPGIRFFYLTRLMLGRVSLVCVVVHHCAMLCRISSETRSFVECLVFIRLIWFDCSRSWLLAYHSINVGMRCSILNKLIDSLLIGWWRIWKVSFRNVTLLLNRLDTVTRQTNSFNKQTSFATQFQQLFCCILIKLQHSV